MKLNHIICIEEQQNDLLLKIKDADHLVKLSKLEYAIISYYCQVLNKKAVIVFFSTQVAIGEQQLDLLLELAVQTKIIVPEEEKKYSYIVQLRLKRRKAILELFSLDFTGTMLERLLEKKKVLLALVILGIGLTLGALVYLNRYLIAFVENYKTTLYLVPYSLKQLIAFIYIGAFCSIVIHEWGHYLFYKLYGGKCSIFGIGLLLYMIPVFYARLYIQQIPKKKHRLVTYAGGAIFDGITVLFLLVGTVVWKDTHPTFAFIGYAMLISIGIRSMFNVNVFLPYTDGYFILNELVGKESLWQESYSVFKRFFKEKITAKRLLLCLYFLLSCLAVVVAWSCFAIPLFLLLMYAFSF